MGIKKIMSAFLAATVAASSLATSSLTAFAEVSSSDVAVLSEDYSAGDPGDEGYFPADYPGAEAPDHSSFVADGGSQADLALAPAAKSVDLTYQNSEAQDYLNFTVAEGKYYIKSAGYDEEHNENQFWFSCQSSDDVKEIAMSQLAEEYKGLSWGSYDITDASLEGVSLSDIQYRFYIQHGASSNDWQWTEFEGRSIDFDTILQTIPASNIFHTWGIICRLPVSANSGIKIGDICVFNCPDFDGTVTTSGIGSKPLALPVTDTSKGIFASYRESVISLFDGVVPGKTTFGQLKSAYSTLKYEDFSIASCNDSRLSPDDFSVQLGFEMSDSESITLGDTLDIAGCKVDDTAVIKDIFFEITAYKALDEDASDLESGYIVANSEGGVYSYKYDNSTMYLVVQNNKSNSCGMECSNSIDLLSLIRSEDGRISTFGDLRKKYAFINFSDFHVGSITVDSYKDKTLENNVLQWNISMMTNTWYEWYGSSGGNMLDLSTIPTSDDASLDMLNLNIYIPDYMLTDLGLERDDLVVVNPYLSTVAKVKTDLKKVTAEVKEDEYGNLYLSPYREFVSIPGVSFGSTTYGELMSMYSGIFVKGLNITQVSDSRLVPGNFFIHMNLLLSGNNDNGTLYHGGSAAFPLNGSYSIGGTTSTNTKLSSDFIVNGLLVELKSNDINLASVGFKAGDIVEFAFNGTSLDSEEWDGSVRVSGNTIIWDACPYEDSGSTHRYGIAIDGRLMDSYFPKSSGQYKYDLARLALVAGDNFYGQNVDLSVMMYSSSEYKWKYYTSSVQYEYNIGKVDKNISTPELKWQSDYPYGYRLCVDFGNAKYGIVHYTHEDSDFIYQSDIYSVTSGMPSYIWLNSGKGTAYIISVDADGNISRTADCQLTDVKTPVWDNNLRTDENGMLKFDSMEDFNGNVWFRIYMNNNLLMSSSVSYEASQERFSLPLLLAMAGRDGSISEGDVDVTLWAYDTVSDKPLANGSGSKLTVHYNGELTDSSLAKPQEAYCTVDGDVVSMKWSPVDNAVGYLVEYNYNGEHTVWETLDTTFTLSMDITEDTTISVYSIGKDAKLSQPATVVKKEVEDWDPKINIDYWGNLAFEEYPGMSDGMMYRLYFYDGWVNSMSADYSSYRSINITLLLARYNLIGVDYFTGDIPVHISVYDDKGNIVASGGNHPVTVSFNGSKVDPSLDSENASVVYNQATSMYYLNWDKVDGAIGYLVSFEQDGSQECWTIYSNSLSVLKKYISDPNSIRIYAVDRLGTRSTPCVPEQRTLKSWDANISIDAAGNLTFDPIPDGMTTAGNVAYTITLNGTFVTSQGAGYDICLPVILAARTVVGGVNYGKGDFRLTAVNWDTGEQLALSTDSVEYDFKGGVKGDIAQASGFRMVRQGDVYKISWTPVSGAAGYFTPVWGGNDYYWTTEAAVYINKNYINSIGSIYLYSVDKDGFVSDPVEYQIERKPVIDVAVDSGKVTLSWIELAADAVYAIYQYDDGKYIPLSKNCKELSYTVTGLTNGTTYKFLVQAYIDGKWTKFTTDDLVSATPYSKNTDPVVTTKAGPNSVTLSWDNIDGAEKYAVYMIVDGKFNKLAMLTGTSYTAAGLVGGQEYTFLVQAYVNGRWSSYSSDKFVKETPEKVASIDPVVTAKPGPGTVTLSWNKVDGTEKYVVYSIVNGKFNKLATLTALTYTAKNLTGGQEYTFLVQAYVDGRWSSYAADKYVKAVPEKVASIDPVVTAKAGPGCVTLSWNKVDGAEKYAIYSIVNGKFNKLATQTALTYTAKNLVGGQEYTFLVQAYVNGKWSSYAPDRYVYETPEKAVNIDPVVETKVGPGTVTLSWKPVTGASKYAVYIVDNGKFNKLSTLTGTEYTAKNLVGEQEYTFLVQSYVDGRWSSYASDRFVKAMPEKVVNIDPEVITTAGPGSITLSWEPIENAEKYAVYNVVGGSFKKLATLTGSSYTVTGLIEGKEYTFLVQAYVNGKWSSYAPDRFVTDIPDKEISIDPDVSTVAGQGTVTLRWEPINGAEKYVVYNVVGGKFNKLTTTTALEYTAKNLVGGQEYTFLVQAYVDGRWSSYSSDRYVMETALEVVSTDPDVTYEVTDDGIRLSWEPVDGATKYNVYNVVDGRFVKLSSQTATTYTVNGVFAGTFLVQAYVDGKWSSYAPDRFVTV